VVIKGCLRDAVDLNGLSQSNCFSYELGATFHIRKPISYTLVETLLDSLSGASSTIQEEAFSGWSDARQATCIITTLVQDIPEMLP